MNLWFNEEDSDGLRFSYQVKDVLCTEKTPFQKISVIDTVAYGRTLLLDDLVMCTEKDEFVYHEMIAHIPSLFCQNLKNVLVIGGGDGGTVRELCKHTEIESITLCEIDARVIEVSKDFFPNISCGYKDPRVKILVGDGVKYVAEHAAQAFDLIIVDSTDPIGPGEGLFTKEFYGNVSRLLTSGGAMVCQSESPWFERSLLQRISNHLRSGFDHLHPYIASIPTYPRGLWSFTLATHQERHPLTIDWGRLEAVGTLRYLNPAVAAAAFALPNFYLEKVGK